jgi:hypothetical protein
MVEMDKKERKVAMKQIRINELKLKFLELFDLEDEMESFKESLKVSEAELEKDNKNSEIKESIDFFKGNIKKIENEALKENLRISRHAEKAGFTSKEIKKIKDEARKEYSISRKDKLFNFYNVSSNDELKDLISKEDEKVDELVEFIDFFYNCESDEGKVKQ